MIYKPDKLTSRMEETSSIATASSSECGSPMPHPPSAPSTPSTLHHVRSISDEDASPAPHLSEISTPAPPPSPTAPQNPATLPSPRAKRLSPADFFFGRTLGEGAYARVVHARAKPGIGSPGAPTDYAVKILEKRHIKRENKIKYVMMEKRLLSQIHCPLIVKLTVSFQDEEYLYMMMDLCTGGELLGVVRHYRDQDKDVEDTACPLQVTQFYIASVISALTFIHSRKIIHRDLKPENVLLMSSGVIKLGDFGTAIDLSSDTERHNSFVGTAEYVSPEVLNNADATASVDLWAIGCMAFQMAVGRPPFQAPTEFGMFNAIINHANGSEPLTYPAELDPIVADFTAKFLVEEPSARLGADDGVEIVGATYDSIKSHPIFTGFDWDALDNGTLPPPYVPPEPTWLNDTSSLIDGAEDLDAYFLEGDATPIEVMQSVPQLASSPPSGNSAANNASGRGSIDDQTWRKFIPDALESEEIVKTGRISKRKGFFSKNRQLILTDLPRLVYVDPTAMEYKGNIPWNVSQPVQVKKLSDKKFDVVATMEGGEKRAYHLTAQDGADHWIEAIQHQLDVNK